MEPIIEILTIFLRVANLLMAAYLLYATYSLFRANRTGSFSRTNKLMMVAVLLFFVVEFTQVFKLIPSETFVTLQSVFAFLFLLMLIQATLEIKKGVLAHDHLMRRKQHRPRMVDVE